MDSHLSKKLPDRSAERDQRLWSKTMKDLEQKPRIFSQAMLGIKKILARHEVVPDNKKRRVCMLRKIIILMIGAILFQTQIAEATGQAPWAPAACKSLVQGSVTINKVTKIGVAPFDPTGGSNMMEISGTRSNGAPISVRFKIVRDPCTNCTQVEANRVDSSNICQDNARIALALNKPLQFLENGQGALCEIDINGSNLKVVEIRHTTSVNTLLPPGTCAVGVLPGVQQILFPDDPSGAIN